MIPLEISSDTVEGHILSIAQQNIFRCSSPSVNLGDCSIGWSMLLSFGDYAEIVSLNELVESNQVNLLFDEFTIEPNVISPYQDMMIRCSVSCPSSNQVG